MELCISILEFYFILFFYFFGSKEIQETYSWFNFSFSIDRKIKRYNDHFPGKNFTLIRTTNNLVVYVTSVNIYVLCNSNYAIDSKSSVDVA